jgi:cellulose synthase/poly-beta-1,6-N-acetylglucosamine synthase-like glycosyltransferase
MSKNLEEPLTDPDFLPKVSVAIPIYNGETDIPDLIECLRSQTYPTDRVEYLLVNNNSSDRTAIMLEAAVTEAAPQGLQLSPLIEDRIQSSYAARNAAIRSARGDILAFTDADCRPQSDWLEQIIQPFIKNPRVAVVVGELAALPGHSLLEKYAERSGIMSQKFLLEHPFCPYGQTANLAIRKKALEQIGLFRPYLTTGGDADICWRILRNSDWQLEFAPQAIIRHRHRSNLRELKSQWQRYGRSNRYLHELYGVALMRELTFKESLYRMGRWFLKELPRDSLKTLLGQGIPIDLIKTPIDLFCYQARTAGQREARLPEIARQIEWLDASSDPS